MDVCNLDMGYLVVDGSVLLRMGYVLLRIVYCSCGRLIWMWATVDLVIC